MFALALTASLVACSGKDGAPGAPGSPGQMSNGGRIVSTLKCSGTIFGLSGDASSLNGLEVNYDAVITSGGDVYATASVADEQAQVSGTAFYAAGQAGSLTGKVSIVGDFDYTADFATWDISVNRSTMVTTAVYTDDSLGYQSPVTLNFTASACTQSNW